MSAMRRARVGLLALAMAASGCIIVADDDRDDDWNDSTYADDVDDEAALVAIDVGASVGAIDPGFGAGVFLEVDAAGRWYVFTTCDTELSGYACGFEIDLRADGLQLEDVVELESDDDVDTGGNAIDAFFVTDADVDELSFTTAPGALVELTMFLDGVSQPTFVYWVGEGVQNEGAPTNPVVFEPR